MDVLIPFIIVYALKNINSDNHFQEYASLRTAIMNILNKVNIHIPELQCKEYGQINLKNISLVPKNFMGM